MGGGGGGGAGGGGGGGVGVGKGGGEDEEEGGRKGAEVGIRACERSEHPIDNLSLLRAADFVVLSVTFFFFARVQ